MLPDVFHLPAERPRSLKRIPQVVHYPPVIERLIAARFDRPGLYVMDEPESALSFRGQLGLLRAIHGAVRVGSQFIMATATPQANQPTPTPQTNPHHRTARPSRTQRPTVPPSSEFKNRCRDEMAGLIRPATIGGAGGHHEEGVSRANMATGAWWTPKR